MKQFYKLFILVCIYTCMQTALSAQTFHVLDVNKSTDADPNNGGFNVYFDQAYSKFEYAVLNGVSYFAANDGIHGIELWKSDGTANGTVMIKDINPGSAPSNAHDMTVSGNKIYFSADDGVHGLELWVTDGTEANTKMLKDIYPASIGSSPAYLIDGNGELYFFTTHANPDDQLWKSDGTKEGTIKIADFYTSKFNYSKYGNQLAYANGRLFFAMNGGGSIYFYGDAELWTSDGTSNGTMLVKQINPNFGAYLYSLIALNGLVYFSADDGTGTGRSLWVSDGTYDGTNPVNNLNNIHLNDDAFNNEYNKLAIKDNKLFFSGYSPFDNNDGSELCSYDPSNAGNSVEVVKYFNPGFYSYNLYNFTVVNNDLFFTVFNSPDQTLWKSDGTTEGTVQVKDINPGGLNVYYYRDFKNADGTLLFSFANDENGIELWKSDGTEDGTVMIKDIFPGIYSSDDGTGANITYIGNNISLFKATDGKTGTELWETNLSESGTLLVKDINQSATASSFPSQPIPGADSSKLFFSAVNPKYGFEMHVTDGTVDNTDLLKDIYPGSGNSSPSYIASTNSATYFFANIPDSNATGTSDARFLFRLFKTNTKGTNASIVSTPDLDNLTAYVEYVTTAGDLYYMTLYNYSTGNQELWRSDGTTAGTYAVKTDIDGFYYPNTTAVNNSLYFINYDFNTGYFQLCETDGTVAGTHIVQPVSASFINIQSLYAFNGKVYFDAVDNATFVQRAWRSDGTDANTKPIGKTVFSFNWIGALNGWLYFAGQDLNKFNLGVELWATNGTNTVFVKDINPGPLGSYPNSGVTINGILYFSAVDAYGFNLYKTNGTRNGTVALTSQSIGDPTDLVNANGHLYFINNNALWQSDGTQNGTSAVNDNSLKNISDIHSLTAVTNKLCFIGFSPKKGEEIFSGDVSNNQRPGSTQNMITAANAERITLFPNPTKKLLNMVITGDDYTDLSIVNSLGKTVLNKTINGTKKGTIIQLDVSQLSADTYFIQLISADRIVKTASGFVKE